jgi:transposase InsO family protein
MKKQMLQKYQSRIARKELCEWLSLSRSTSYYKATFGKRGAKPSTHTLTRDGKLVANEEVIHNLITQVFSEEFNRYGYQLCTEELRAMGYMINAKKVYRLMKENDLLLERIKTDKIDRVWVKWRKIENAKPLEYLCMDIKYVYIHGSSRNAYLLSIIDVATRYVVGWSLQWNMRHTDVILCLSGVLKDFKAKEIILRTDNGSQFIANDLRKFCKTHAITQEFTHVATPEENSYVESLFSLIEREVIQCYEFESLYHARDVMQRYFNWHNNKRRRHALGKKSPAEYWHTFFPCHPVKPPKAVSGDFVKGDDTFKNNNQLSSLVLPLTKSERGLSLLNRMTRNMS